MPLDESAADDIRRFEEQFRRQPESLVFARLADALRKAGDAQRALEVLEQGIRRHADYLSAHIVRARTYRDLGRIGEARSAFERVIEIDARNLVAIQGLAEIARDENDVAAEISWLEQLALADPQSQEPAERLEFLRRQIEREEPVEPEPEQDGINDSTDGTESWWTEPVTATPTSVPGTDSPVDSDLVSELWSGPAIMPEEAREDAEESVEPGTPELEHGTPEIDAGTPEFDAGTPELDDGSPEHGSPDEAWWFEPPAGGDTPTSGYDEIEDADEGEDADLLTRTMAELYARQGLTDEAEAIYRELLRDRPDDEGLRAGLDAVLGMRAARGASRTSEAPPTEDETTTPGDESVVSEQPIVELEPTAGPADPETESAADFLAGLLRTGEELALRLPEPPAPPSVVRSEDLMVSEADVAEPGSENEPEAARPVLEEWLRGLRS